MQLDILYNEDCLVGMKRIPDGSIDCIISDLPYGTTACKWDSVIPFEPLWEQYRRVTKKNAAIVLTASQPFTSALVMSNPGMFRHEWIWQKNCGSNFATARFSPFKEHESVLVFGKVKSTYNPKMQDRVQSGASRVAYRYNASRFSELDSMRSDKANRELLRLPSSVQKFNRETGLHPTQKPVALFEYLIRTYTNEGEVVLDSCVGSGTTSIACMNTGRHYIGFEKDPGYFAIAQKRIAEHKPQLSLTA